MNEVKYDRETIIANIQGDDRWLERAVLAIWRFQTYGEKRDEITRLKNNVGFNSVDGKILTSLGNQLSAGRRLSDKQKLLARGRMRKYCGQLLNIIEANGDQVDKSRRA
jgi:hypothetical protein